MEKVNVLLVDDERDFMDIMKRKIECWGYNVIPISNGKKAIDAVRSGKGNIVVLDYIMPKMDGLSILKEIRKINLQIPVIMLTAHPDEKSINWAERLGVLAFIPKFKVGSDAESRLKPALKMAKEKFLAYKVNSAFKKNRRKNTKFYR